MLEAEIEEQRVFIGPGSQPDGVSNSRHDLKLTR